jgi:hypothetical protein
MVRVRMSQLLNPQMPASEWFFAIQAMLGNLEIVVK